MHTASIIAKVTRDRLMRVLTQTFLVMSGPKILAIPQVSHECNTSTVLPLIIDVHLDRYTISCVIKTIRDLTQKRIDGLVAMNHLVTIKERKAPVNEAMEMNKSLQRMAISLPTDRILVGDCVELMNSLPECSVDLIFADTYNLQLKTSYIDQIIRALMQ